MRDGSVPAYICRDPDLHQEWKMKLLVTALFFFAVGVAAQWWWRILP